MLVGVAVSDCVPIKMDISVTEILVSQTDSGLGRNFKCEELVWESCENFCMSYLTRLYPALWQALPQSLLRLHIAKGINNRIGLFFGLARD